MASKKRLLSKLENSKEKIEAAIDNASIRVFRPNHLLSFLKNNEMLEFDFGIVSTVSDDVISFLLDKSHLKKVKFLTPRPETLYLWRTPNEYELMPILRPKGYYTHLSAMYFHSLLDDQPQNLYFNHEQQSRPRAGNLEQGRIDNAFKKKQRITKSRTKYDGKEFWLLNGKQTGDYGVITLRIFDNIDIRVTDVERTLIDITVRPAYAGGVKSVLEAYRIAQPKVSVSILLSTLRSLNYVYPYHQSIGFYIEAAGNYTIEALNELLDFSPLDYDFYLDYEMKSPAYSRQWKIYYPKDLIL